MKRSEIFPSLKWIIIGWISEVLVKAYSKIASWYICLIIKSLQKGKNIHVSMKKNIDENNEKLYRDMIKMLEENKK